MAGSDASSQQEKLSFSQPGTKHRTGQDTVEADKSIESQHQLNREKKIQDKKRKRLEMRREYEAQQQFESSESSNGQAHIVFRPGRTITMDQAMVLSRIARYVQIRDD